MRISSWSLRHCLKRLMGCKGTVLYLVIALMFPHRFRWVFCQLEVLRQSFPSSVRCVLAELPESLDETYERILQQIPKSNREHAHRLLQCLTVSIRPLHVEELAEVLAINFSAPGGTPLVDEKLRWEDKEQAVLSACSSLIAIVQDGHSRRVQFSHFSVQEFLTSDRLATSMVDTLLYHHIHLEPAHTIMAQACLSVLLRLDSSMDRWTIKSCTLARYAGKHFGDHVEFENVLPHVTEGVDNLLDPDKPHFDTWVWLQTDDCGSLEWYYSRIDECGYHTVPACGSSQASPRRVSPLYYVAAFGHFSLAHRLISKCPQDLHSMDDNGCTPLHIAVLAGKAEVSQLLIEHSINLDVRDTEDWTLLHMAAYSGLFEVSRILLERHEAIKSCLNMRNKQGRTALHLASRYYHPSIVALLLTFGADVKAQDKDNMTPLHLALRGPPMLGFVVHDERSNPIAQLLLAHGASVHARDKNNQTPLHVASSYSCSSTVALLLKMGSDVDSRDDDDMTPLLFALGPLILWEEDSRSVAAQLLLEHGANIHMQNKKGQTALHFASQSQLSQIVALLLKLGLDVDAKDNDDMTPLHFAPTRPNLSDDDVRCGTAARVLLEHGASVHTRNKNGQTPLHLASLHRFSGIVALLLMFGAEVDVRDNDNMTPLLLAPGGEMLFSFHDEDVRCSATAQLLLVHGANVNVRNNNYQTPLHLASQSYLSNSLALLLKFGADVDAQDVDNMTPLHVAISSSPQSLRRWCYPDDESDEGVKVGVIPVLLKHGANIQVQNNKGETPSQVAAARGEQKVVQLLV